MGIALFVAMILNVTAALQLMSASAEPWFQKLPADENGEGGMRWKSGCAISAALLFVLLVLGYIAFHPPYPSLEGMKEGVLVPDNVQSDSSCPYLLQSIDNANFHWDQAKSAYEKLILSNHLLKPTFDVKCSKLSIYRFFHRKKNTIYDSESKDSNNITHTPHIRLRFYRIVQSDEAHCEHWKNYSRPSERRLRMSLNLSGNITSTESHIVPGFWECTS
jgi:hypothetical protein